ncbi:hypothetical protein [Salinibacter grassmerensis]|uniref:hypothetical protein n=1 Tax=Salinibacter grassmerensis TaxID=3040353 RepID=UPI0021E894B4|nr:hypothetical protein [Salinibacter grassmerensis]
MCVAFLGLTREVRVRYAGGVLCLLLLLGGSPSSAVAQRFLTDDPLWHDPDRMDMPFPEPTPSDHGIGPLEFFERSFGVRGDYAVPATNVNTVGGVPNSSWYTNRHYRSSMSRAALRRGPNQEPGPSSRSRWRVVDLGGNGELPRATIRDTTGRAFRILFDAPAHPEMATGAAMISSRLLHALGYNVPQHWLRRVRVERLVPEPESGVTQSRVDSLLTSAAQRPDSTYRVLATRISSVERRIGPFQFKGTRADDGNDVFPHEDRRELRGLRVIAAWIHHSKIRPRHTLDVGMRVEGRRFVRHYLTDLHLTLGSAGAAPKSEWSGHEHVLELGRVFERIGTLGLSGGDWAEIEPPNNPAVGRFGTGGFDPRAWRPEWPNLAFQRTTPADAFWAAKKIRNFSCQDLRAIVSTADYSSAEVADHMVRTLLARRDAIGQAFLDWGGGLDRFAVRSGRLAFKDLRAAHGQAPDTLQRTVKWRAYDNRADEVSSVLARTTSSQEAVPLPNYSPSHLRASLVTPRAGTTHVFVRQTEQGQASPGGRLRRRVVGVDRTAPSTAQRP